MGPLGVSMQAAVVVALALATSCTQPPAQLAAPEVLVYVDTDAPVPSLVSRLRVDLYTSDGAVWYETADFSLPDPSDWPASFALATPDPGASYEVLVRLRAYPEGQVRDYHGERFTSRTPAGPPGASAVPASPPTETCAPSACELPRLTQGGTDITPKSEPQPTLAIDRLLLVSVGPGSSGALRVTQRGACFGTMADLAGQQTCLDTDAQLVAVGAATVSPDTTPPAPAARAFGAEVACPLDASPRPPTVLADGTSLHDDEVCVPGGTFFLGNEDVFGAGDASAIPQHVVSVSPFYMDRYEVTVARWRDAVRSHGLVSPDPPVDNESVLSRDVCRTSSSADHVWCTWSARARVPEDREDYAMSCVTWRAARAFCQARGGDLPTEAQWEYVAQSAGRGPNKTAYSYGDADPTCDQAVFARITGCSSACTGRDLCLTMPCPNTPDCACAAHAPTSNPQQGPQAVDAAPLDTSVQLGVVGMTGGVSELALDAFHAFSANCWAAAPMLDPSCIDAAAVQHTVRGGSWAAPGGFPGHFHSAGTTPNVIGAGQRRGDDVNPKTAPTAVDFGMPEVGFRCVRPIGGP